MKSRKHILILTPGFPASADDTTCIPALQVWLRAMQRNYGGDTTLSVIAFQYPFHRGSYDWEGISCWSAGGRNRKLPAKVLTWKKVIDYAGKLHRKQPVTLVHSCWLHDCTLVGQWIAKRTGAAHVAHIMGQDVLPENRYLKWIARERLHIIANSPFSADTLCKNFGLKSDFIIPFGIDQNEFPPLAGSENRTIDLLNVGSLTPVKNQQLFVRIFSQLSRKFGNLQGRIIGDGPGLESLRGLIRQYGLEHNLILEGAQPRPVVLQRMSESRILLHTAPFESAGFVFPEALYSGMKVVCFPTGLVPESPSSFVCRDEIEMLTAIENILTRYPQPVRETVPLVSETCRNMMTVWEKVVT